MSAKETREARDEAPSSSTDAVVCVVDEPDDVDDEDEDIGEEKTLTLREIIEEENELAEKADEVLAGSDEKNCSYSEGYVKRQALYSCLTCTGGRCRAGICLACSYSCHEGHELVELYTKRNFRCDCGNSNFSQPCKLLPKKDLENLGNTYNQNFDGVYCVCAKPYPCDEFQNVDMLQCCVCEDWFHSIHLGPVSPPDDAGTYDSVTCATCLAAHPLLLRYYALHSVKKLGDAAPSGEAKPERNGIGSENEAEASPENEPAKVEKTEENVDGKETMTNGVVSSASDSSTGGGGASVKEEESDGADESSSVRNGAVDAVSSASRKRPAEENGDSDVKRMKKDAEDVPEVAKPSENGSSVVSGEAEASGSNDSQPSSSISSDSGCKLPPKNSQTDEIVSAKASAFWAKGWREELCRCAGCLKAFRAEKLDYLLDPEDTMDAYVDKGKDKADLVQEMPSSSGIMRALSPRDRFAFVEVMQGYSEMSSKFMDFLKPFAEDGRVVSREDINAFFARLKEERSSRSVEIPHFCR